MYCVGVDVPVCVRVCVYMGGNAVRVEEWVETEVGGDAGGVE